jgi:Mrp family chromosome partitioning ATPase
MGFGLHTSYQLKKLCKKCFLKRRSIMSTTLSEETVYDALSTIKHPEMPNTNLLELGMIPSVNVHNGHIKVTLALPTLKASVKDDLILRVEQSVEKIKDVLKVEVDTVEMDTDQKEAFKEFSQEAKHRPRVDRHIDNVIAVMSGKGGVGKSSVAVLLASALERRGLKVGVLDADITGPSIPMMFGAQQSPKQDPDGILPVQSHQGVKIMSINLLLPDTDQPVVWRGPLISRAIEQFWRDILWGDLDYLIVDLPPGTADAALTVMQSLPLDGIVLVTSPQDLSGMVVRKAANMANHLGIRLIGLIENMSHVICPKCGTQIEVFGRSRSYETVRLIGIPLLGHLPFDTRIATLCDQGEIERYVGDEFEEIVNKVMAIVSDYE